MSSNVSTKIIALLWIWMSFDGCCLVSRWDKTGSHWYTLINNMFRTNSHMSLGFEHDWRSPKRLIKTKTGLGCFSAPACFFPARKDGLPKSSKIYVMSRLEPQPIYTRMFAHAIRSQFSSCWFLLIQSNQKICRKPGTPEKMPSKKTRNLWSYQFVHGTFVNPPTSRLQLLCKCPEATGALCCEVWFQGLVRWILRRKSFKKVSSIQNDINTKMHW